MIDPAERKKLERRVMTLSNNRPVWIALTLQVAAFFVPSMGVVAIMLMAAWLIAVTLARWLTLCQLSELSRKERNAEVDTEDFVKERGDAIRRRMQAMLETEARDQARRRNSPSMFRGNCIDVTPE